MTTTINGYGDVLTLSSASTAAQVYTPAGIGAVATTVQDELRARISVRQFGAVGDGVTDDTVAVKKALVYAQSLCDASFIYSSDYATVQFEQGKVYVLTGDNPLGTQSADNVKVRYGIDFNGAKILWTPTLVTDALFGRMANVFGLSMKNGSIDLRHVDLTPFGSFMKSGSGAVTSVLWANYQIDHMEVRGESARWYSIFDVDGTTLCSDTSVTSSNFYGFQYLFNSTNPEAVNWNFVNCGALPNVAGFRVFNINASAWSGGISYIGGGIIGQVAGTFVYLRTTTFGTVGNLYLNTRTECRAQTTVVDSNAGCVVVENANLFAGGGPTTSINAKVDGNAVVKFKNCTVYTNTTVVARTVADITTNFGSYFRGSVTYDDCFMGIYRPSITYVDSAGAATTHYDAVANALVTPAVVCAGSTYGYKGVSGIPYLTTYSMDIYTPQRYVDAPVGGGGLGLAYLMSTGVGYVVQPNTIITSIKATVNAVAIGTYSLFGILMDAQTTPDATLQWSNTGVKIHNYEAIPVTKEGIAYASSTLPSTIKRIYFAAYDVVGAAWVKVGALQGHLEITCEPILHKQQRPSADNTMSLA